MTTKPQWYNTAEKTPPQDVEVEITSPHFIGTRTARLKVALGVWWELTDCTHPMQNTTVVLTGSGWRNLTQ